MIDGERPGEATCNGPGSFRVWKVLFLQERLKLAEDGFLLSRFRSLLMSESHGQCFDVCGSKLVGYSHAM